MNTCPVHSDDPMARAVATNRRLLGQAPQACTCEHLHDWQVEYLPDPMSAGSVIRSGALFCACGMTVEDRDGDA